MFAYVCAATGWTWDYIGEHMTLPRLYALWEHWATYPPMHITAARFAGVKPAKPRAVVNDEAVAYVQSRPTMMRRRPGPTINGR
ncbi:MAG: hypothetical protein ACREQ5_35490 [Candidatus Dormibacteria bacterium]